MKRIDLHSHTTHSDGTTSPEDLVRTAHEIGLAALAVTDHDNTSALPAAHAAGARLGVEILDGCEVSTRYRGALVHVLVYGRTLEDEGFQRLLAALRRRRDERNLKMLDRLEGLGMPVTLEEVRKHSLGRVVARPHFARAMVERGHVDDMREAFRHHIGDGCPAYVMAELPEPQRAIEAATRAGAVAVLAHPRQMKLGARRAYEQTLGAFKEAGLVGVEVQHPSHKPEHRRLFSELAEALDLVPTGGSDFHGEHKPHIALGVGDGTIEVSYETWLRLVERMPSP